MSTLSAAAPLPAPRPAWAVPLALGLVWLTMGGNFLGFKVAVETVPPFLMISARLLLAAAILLPLALAFDGRLRPGSASVPRRTPWPTARQARSAVVMAVLLLVIGQGSVVWGVQRLDAGTAAVLTSSIPLWVALLGFVWLRQRPSRRGLAGLGLGFVGLVVLSLAGGGAGARLDPFAVAAVLAGAASVAAGVLYGHDADMPENAALGTAIEMLAAGAVLLAVSLAAGETGGFHLGQVSGRSWTALAYLVVGGSLVGFGAFVWLTRAASAATASSFAYVGPVVALALSVPLLGEALGPIKLAAAGLALAGAALLVGADKGAPPCPSKLRPCTQ